MQMGEATPALEPRVNRQGEELPQLQAYTRIDWRTGRPVQVRGAAFWKEHDGARRIEQGLSVAAYCEANGLAGRPSGAMRVRARQDRKGLMCAQRLPARWRPCGGGQSDFRGGRCERRSGSAVI
jgi:hypothetical protein